MPQCLLRACSCLLRSYLCPFDCVYILCLLRAFSVVTVTANGCYCYSLRPCCLHFVPCCAVVLVFEVVVVVEGDGVTKCVEYIRDGDGEKA
jgi:hypothetical protein